MNKSERILVLGRQEAAGDLWSGLAALAALIRKVAMEDARSPHRNPGRWGDDSGAAANVAEQLVEKASELACSLDPSLIEDGAVNADRVP